MNEQEKNAILTIEQQNKALAGINQEMDLLNLLRIMLQQEIEALQSQQDLIKLLIEKQKNKLNPGGYEFKNNLYPPVFKSKEGIIKNKEEQ